MDIKNLSLKKILGDDDWIYNPDFQYADFNGRAELHKGDRIILFRKGDEEAVSVVSLQAVGLCDKKLIYTANKLIEDIGISLRIGDSKNKIVKKFGTPDFVDCIEEGYYRYYLDYGEHTDEIFITRYHYLIAPDLLVCFGIPERHYQKLTDLEIVNDFQMVSAIMENRIACKKLGNEICPSKDRLSLIHQTIENRRIEGIQAKDVYFLESEIKNCSIEGIQSEKIVFANCVFEHVVFHSYYKAGYFCMGGKCKFKNCVFHDTFGVGIIYIAENLFQDCLFEGISIGAENNGAFIYDNKFINCIFKDMDWVGHGLFSNIVSGGKMKQIIYNEKGDISENQFSNMLIEDMEGNLDYPFCENELDSVIFRNVTLKGQMEENNNFVKCDTNGFTLIPKSNVCIKLDS